MTQVLTTLDYNDIERHIAHHAPNARLLGELTAQLDDDYHTLWLDGQTVWHAWVEPGDDEWHLDHEPATEAIDWIRQQLDGQGVFDRIADPSRYSEATEARYLESDEDAMEEYYDIELAAIVQGFPDMTARDVDQVIQAHISRVRAEAARLASLRAHHVRRTYQGDGERGWKAAAARGLRITPVSLGDILKDDDARAERRRQAASLSRRDSDE